MDLNANTKSAEGKKIESENSQTPLNSSVLKEIEHCQEACENAQYTQSGKVSSTSRTIIYSIIGTIWIIIYNSTPHKIEINSLLVVALIMSFIYLLLDISHYFIDTIRYRRESFRLDNCRFEPIYNLNRCKEIMDNIAIASFCAVVGKYFLTIITSAIFIFGILEFLKII